jgi:hypothetical protein
VGTPTTSGGRLDGREKPLARCVVSVPQTDTGGQVEQTQVDGRPLVKELGKLTPYLRKKACRAQVREPSAPERGAVAAKRPRRLFTKNTGLCEGASRRIGADACPVPEG